MTSLRWSLLISCFFMLAYSCQGNIVTEPSKERADVDMEIRKERAREQYQEQPSDANAPELDTEPLDRTEWDPVLCQKAKNDWKIFQKKSQICKEGDGCIVVGYRGTCDCGYGIAGGGDIPGLSINAKFEKEASEIEARYFRYCERSKRCTTDALASDVGPCKGGKCTATLNLGCQP